MSNIDDYLNNLRNYKKRPGGFEQFPWNPKTPSKEAFYRQVEEEQMLYEQELREAREQELEESADAGVGGDSDAKSQFSNVLLKYVVEGEDASNLTDVQVEVMKEEVRQKAADELTGGDTSLITVEISDGSIAFDISVLLPGLLSQNTALIAALAELAKQVEQQILTVAKEVAGVENLTITSGTVETKDTLNPEPTELPPAEPTDTDGDGVPDDQDTFPNDATETVDTDGDGVGDNADAFPNDATETVDTDGDGVGDNADALPHDSTETTDTDGDGVGDNSDDFPSDATEWQDSDSDGVGDNADAFPTNAAETADTDGDGVGDNADAFPSDATETTDTDGDGVGDNADYDPNDPNVQTEPILSDYILYSFKDLPQNRKIKIFARSSASGMKVTWNADPNTLTSIDGDVLEATEETINPEKSNHSGGDIHVLVEGDVTWIGSSWGDLNNHEVSSASLAYLNKVTIRGMSSVTKLEYAFMNTGRSDVTDNPSADTVAFDLKGFDTSNVESAVGMFRTCYISSVVDVDEWNLDFSSLKYAAGMFEGASTLETITWTGLDLSNYDTVFNNVFKNCQSLVTADLSNWTNLGGPSKLLNMSGFFQACLKLENLTGLDTWDVSYVSTMAYFFRNCEVLKAAGIGDWQLCNLLGDAWPSALKEFLAYAWVFEEDLSNMKIPNFTSAEYNFSSSLPPEKLPGWGAPCD